MEKHVLILSDFVGFGDVAMAASRAVLTKMGYTLMCLPTALISNTWNLGAPAVLDTTDYLEQALENLEDRFLQPDAVLIGYLASAEQARLVAEKCAAWRRSGVKIFLDPIFADNGKLYRGVDEERIGYLRQLMLLADFVLPNSTEATFLAGAEVVYLAPAVLEKQLRGFVITGVKAGQTHDAVIVWDGVKQTQIGYERVPGDYSGAGDIFTALFIGHILAGRTPEESARLAIDTTKEWIIRSCDTPERTCAGIPIERFF